MSHNTGDSLYNEEFLPIRSDGVQVLRKLLVHAGEGGGGGGGGLLPWPLVYPGMNQNQKVQTDTLSCFFPSFYFLSSPRLKEPRKKYGINFRRKVKILFQGPRDT